MRASIITKPLAFLQFLMLLAKGVLHLFGYEMSWGVTLWPVWSLLFIVVVFWGLFGAIVNKLRG